MSRKAQAEESRTRLIDTALRVFATKGWGTTSISDLAKAADMAVGLFYHYFENKEALLQAVLERHSFLPELQHLLAVSFDHPAVEVLPQVGQDLAHLLQEKHYLVQILVRESQTNQEIERQFDTLLEEGVRLLGEYIAARVEAGELRPHQSLLTARTLLYTILMSRITQLQDPDFVSDFVQFVLQGIVSGN